MGAAGSEAPQVFGDPFETRASRLPCSRRAHRKFPSLGLVLQDGEDDAILGDATFARVRLVDMTERAMLSLYLKRVPLVAYRNSDCAMQVYPPDRASNVASCYGGGN
jgi:hypothetical protein